MGPSRSLSGCTVIIVTADGAIATCAVDGSLVAGLIIIAIPVPASRSILALAIEAGEIATGGAMTDDVVIEMVVEKDVVVATKPSPCAPRLEDGPIGPSSFL